MVEGLRATIMHQGHSTSKNSSEGKNVGIAQCHSYQIVLTDTSYLTKEEKPFIFPPISSLSPKLKTVKEDSSSRMRKWEKVVRN
jgi:hypothetical protein